MSYQYKMPPSLDTTIILSMPADPVNSACQVED